MRFLIEISGDSRGCSVVPTCGRMFSSIECDETAVDMFSLARSGFDGFLNIGVNSSLNITHIAFGMDTFVQVELPYPWSKHGLISTVPIKTFCKNGYFDSVCHVIKLRISSSFKRLLS